jgi:hypothetical protein
MTAHNYQDDNYAISNQRSQVLVQLPGRVSHDLLFSNHACFGSSDTNCQTDRAES